MKRLLGSLFLAWSFAAPAWAQLPVAESGPMTLAHTTTAFQQTLNTFEAIFQSAQWVLELEGYGSHGSAFETGIIEEMIGRTHTILWDIDRIEREIHTIFSVDTAPDSTQGLNDRLFAIRRIRWESQSAARRVQSLPGLVMQTLQDLRSLWGRILDIAGNRQGSMQIQTLLTKLNETEARSELTMGAFQQAMLTDAQEQTMTDEALQRINKQLFATMPRR